MTERSPTSPETFHADFNGSIPLQTRLIFGGEALQPDFQFDQIELNQAQGFPISPLMNASTEERSDFWDGSTIASDQHFVHWASIVVDRFQNRSWTDSEKDFFTHLGYDVDNFATENAMTIYQKYFGEADEPSRLDLFYSDILQAYPLHSQEDMDNLREQAGVVRWFGGIFGEKSSELFANFLECALTSPETLTNQDLNRLNNLTDREKDLLNFLLPFVPEDNEEEAPEQEEDGPLTFEEAAERLIDYETGRVTDEQIDLSQYFPQFVEGVESLVELGHPLFESQEPKLVLSDVAYAMIDRIADESNNKNEELAFALQGVWKYSEDSDKHVLMASYAVPAMDFSAGHQAMVTLDPQVYGRNSVRLARQTNLQQYFSEKTRFPNGDVVGTIHIHHAGLGDHWRITPSQQDLDQAEETVRGGRALNFWGIATKSRGSLGLKMFCSHLNQEGQIVHEEIPVYTEFDLYNQGRQAA